MQTFFTRPFLSAVGFVAGMIIGSGILALPYTAHVSGFFGVVIGALFALFGVISIHLAYGEIVVNTEASHRLPGYAREYLGLWWGRLLAISQVIAFNAILVIYSIFASNFLATSFGGSEILWSFFLFGIAAFIFLYASPLQIGEINFTVTLFLIALIFLFFGFSFFRETSITAVSWQGDDPLFAFGIWFFALSGLSAVADARGILARHGSAHIFRSVIVWGTIIPFLLYVLFSFSSLSLLGARVSENALVDLIVLFGKQILFWGSLAGFLAVFTSYLGMGYDLRRMYELDLGFSEIISWMVVVMIPPLFLWFADGNVIRIMSIVGGFFLALDSFAVIMILRRVRLRARHVVTFLRFGEMTQLFLICIFIGSISYEILYHIVPFFADIV